MRRVLLAVALLLPLIALALGIQQNQAALSAASQWHIPISGQDPRDPLRGQYVEFVYDWVVEGDVRPCETPASCDLCLRRQGDTVIARISPAGSSCPARVDVRSSRIQFRPAFRPDQLPRFASRLFVSEASAPDLSARLREGPATLLAVLAPDGRLISRRIEHASPDPAAA